MNISITNLCNRRCDYCFQKGWYLSDKAHMDSSVREMSVDDFSALLDWSSNLKYVSIMGGEPLMHSQILDIIRATYKTGRELKIITNLSVDRKILEQIAALPESDCIKMLFINSDYPSQQASLFASNFEYVCRYFKCNLGLSTTLLPNRDKILASAERIQQLVKLYKDCGLAFADRAFSLRLSPYCPNVHEKFVPFDYSLVLAEFFNIVWQHDPFPINLDCTLQDFEVNPQARQAYKDAGILVKRYKCDGSHMAFDVLVDKSIIWCSSCNYIKLDNWTDYPCYKDAKRAIVEKWQAFIDKHRIKVGDESFCLAKEVSCAIPIKSIE